MVKSQQITVFEHDKLCLGNNSGIELTQEHLDALQRFYGEKGVPYYTLINKGVKFCEYVGVIQIGKFMIEVLPKVDKADTDTSKWQNLLIGMLKAVGSFDVRATSNSHLKIKPNTILDLYFELFLSELEYLLHTGLIKRYRKTEGNTSALKGSLQFGKHIQQNLVHQERFYVRYTTYDTNHTLHFILYKALRLLKRINTNMSLHSRIETLLLHFPEMPDIAVSEATFEKLVFNRKSQGYKDSINIAKMLLLNYHPDISKGRNDVIALMFDMNNLWEKFVLVSLQKHATEFSVSEKVSKPFWTPEGERASTIIPDIVLKNKVTADCTVLDTKWKNLNGKNPSPDDLKQMFAYSEYYNAKQVALIYPSAKDIDSTLYGEFNKSASQKQICGIISISTLKAKASIECWQSHIAKCIGGWIELQNASSSV